VNKVIYSVNLSQKMAVSSNGLAVGQGMTIKDILEKVDLFNICVEEDSDQQMKQKNLMKNSEGKTVIQVSDPRSAYLGPKLWDKQISLSLDLETEPANDVMNMEEFLAENNIDLNCLDKQDENTSNSFESMEVSTPQGFWGSIDCPDSPEAKESKPVIRPNVIINGTKKEEAAASPPPAKGANILPKGDNVFLYAESKRARLEREKEERRRKLEQQMDFAPEDLALATVPGAQFNPKERAFDMEELRPQPIIRKRKKTYVPDDAKDDKYWENRIKNNVAARRSREARRLKENQIALRAAFLEKENRMLKQELEDVEFMNTKLATERDILKMKLAKYESFNSN